MGIKCLQLVLLFLFAHTLSYSQATPPDFRQQLAKATTDSQRLNVYKDINAWYRNANNDSIKVYVEEGLRTFEKHGYTKGRTVLLIMMSAIYSEQGLQLASQNAAEEALKLSRELGDESYMAKAHNMLGIVEGHRGKHAKALQHFMKALKKFEKLSDTAGIITTYVKIGATHDFNGNNDKALWYYHRAVDMSLKTVESGNIIYLYTNIGTSHARRGQFDTALSYFQKALAISEKPKYAKARISPLTNIGKVYVEKKDLTTALQYYQRALELAKTLNMREEYAEALQNIGMIEAQANPANTKSLNEALAVAREAGNKHLQADILLSLADVAGGSGNYKAEVEYLKQERIIHDSIFTLNKAREIANLQAEHELAQTNTQLATLKLSEQKNIQHRNVIIVIAGILALTLVTLLFFFSKSRKLNTTLLTREKELQKANETKDRLFSIIGHDLRGPIGNIPMLLSIYRSNDTTVEEKEFILNSLEENSVASLETLEKLLSWGSQQIKGGSINQSVLNVDEIIDNKLRLLGVTAGNKNIKIINKVPSSLQVYADENHFKFIMRNLLSNAVKYSKTGGLVEITAREESDGRFVTFSVKDNGVGIDKEKQQHIFEPYNQSAAGTGNELGTSIGLMLCKDFIQQNGGNIWVKSEPGQGSVFSFSVMSIPSSNNKTLHLSSSSAN